MENLKALVGKRIRSVRKGCGISQEKLAEMTSISAKHIGQIERAETNCTIERIAIICHALGADPADLVVVHDEMTREDLIAQIQILISCADESDLKKILKLMQILLH